MSCRESHANIWELVGSSCSGCKNFLLENKVLLETATLLGVVPLFLSSLRDFHRDFHQCVSQPFCVFKLCSASLLCQIALPVPSKRSSHGPSCFVLFFYSWVWGFFLWVTLFQSQVGRAFCFSDFDTSAFVIGSSGFDFGLLNRPA